MIIYFFSVSFLFLLLCCYSAEASIHNNIHVKQHALFISVPLPGHLGPLVAQGQALADRGWNVTIASTEQMRSLVENQTKQPTSGAGHVTFLSLGECSHAYSTLPAALQKSSNQALGGTTYSWAMSALHIWKWTIDMYPCMFEASVGYLNRTLPSDRPSIVVGDFATCAAIDVADHFNIPMILNNVNLLTMIGPDVMMPTPYVPSIGSAISMQQLQAQPWLLFVQRLLQPLGVLISRLMVDVYMQPVYDGAREKLGLSSKSLHNLAVGKVIMMNSALPFEFIRSLPPHIQLTGPMIDFNQPSLPIENQVERQILTEAATQNFKVIVIAFGTLAPWSKKEIHTLSRSLLSLPQSSFLWKLPPHLHDEVYDQSVGGSVTTHIHLFPWLSDQLALLCDDRVSLFISHCGTHSVHEALSCGTPVLCIPQQGDQIDNAVRLISTGAGLMIPRHELDSERLTNMIDSLLSDQSFEKRAQLVAASMRLAWLGGGLDKAVSIIEHVNQFGSSHLMDNELHQSISSKLGLDVFIVWLVILGVIGWLLYSCIFSFFVKFKRSKIKLE